MGVKWGETKSSPDWTDVFTTMKAIEDLHGVQLMVTLTAGIFDGPAGFTTIAAMKVAKRGEASVLGEPVLALCGEWPCPTHRDYVACLYAALLSIDSRLGSKLWEQMQMPFTADGAGS